MLCHLRFTQLVLCLIVAVLLAGDALSQTAGYTARQPVQGKAAVGGNTTAKIGILLRALRRSPDDAVVLNNLAVLYAAEGQFEKAIETGLHAVEVKPDSAVIRVNLAAVYDRAGKTELALAQAAEAAELDAGNIRARSLLCELELVAGQAAESADCYRGLNDDFPGRYEFRMKFGVALLKARKLEEARDLFEKLLAANGRDVRVMNLLASVYYRMKSFERSSDLLKTAVELDPDDPRLRFNLGISYLALKNRPAALSQYNLIKVSSPDLAQKLYRSLFQKYILDVKK